MKKINNYIIILAVLFVVAIAVLIIMMVGANTKLVTQDPATIALSQADVSNIPSGLIYNSSLSEQTYKVGTYWANDSQLQSAIAQGFTNGYYDYFFFQNPSQTSSIKTIGSSISIYNQSQSAQTVTSTTLNQIVQSKNCIAFNLPTIGDASFGCYFVLNESNTAVSYYDVLFYKNNVAVRTWVGQTGLMDLSSEAVQYANIVANRI